MRAISVRASDEDGFGLVEIMISMLLLGMLFAAAAPLLINSFRVTAKNTTISTASQLVSQRVESARTVSVAGDCAVLRAQVEPATVVTDGRGIALTVTGVVTDCTQTPGSEHDQPRLATVAVTVSTAAAGFANPVAHATTQIFVKFKP